MKQKAYLFQLHNTKTKEVRYSIMSDPTPTLPLTVVAAVVLSEEGDSYEEARRKVESTAIRTFQPNIVNLMFPPIPWR